MTQKLSTALTAEFIGTFALIFIGAGAGALGIGGLVGVALAHGLVVLSFVYAYGDLSGAHVNPAVSFGVFAAGRMDARRLVSYWVFQLAGGIAGALALRFVLGGVVGGLGATTLARRLEVGGASVTVTPFAGFVIEAILTFFLVNAVLQCAVRGRAGQLAGAAIGLTLTLGILMGGPLTGGSLNPARTLGPAVAAGHFADLWVYLAGPLAGAGLAAALDRTVFSK
ncbi:MAG TPA: aquaporin [Solirubrobacterales bacterium]|nr:aquaporin [Solirubrobacterales bacterium]